MDFSETCRVNRRKESTTTPLSVSECNTPNTPDSRLGDITASDLASDIIFEKAYPFAFVLRLRVLQIVCGITAMVMGTVGVIEEREEMNLGLGIPAGGATVLAAAASIHTSRGFGGYRPSSCSPSATLRFLGPSIRTATPLALLWAVACLLHAALIVQACRTLVGPGLGALALAADDGSNVVALAMVEIALATITLVAVLGVLRIDCVYDPDCPGLYQHGAGAGTNAGIGVSVVGLGTTTTTATNNSERASRVAWVV